MKPTIVVKISAEGDPTVGAKHVKGPACYALTKGMEHALGTVASDERTPEFSQHAASQDQSREQLA